MRNLNPIVYLPGSGSNRQKENRLFHQKGHGFYSCRPLVATLWVFIIDFSPYIASVAKASVGLERRNREG